MKYEECCILRSLGLPKDRIHPTAVVCGNIYRIREFSQYGTNYIEYKEFLCYKAAEVELDGQKILLLCHGVSSTSAAPILRELMEMGVKVVIRAGTAGSTKPDQFKAGDLCVGFASIRGDSSSVSEVDMRYPSVADYDVVDCILDNSDKLGFESFLGLIYSVDTFSTITFKPEGFIYGTNKKADAWESETSILFVISSLYGAKAGCICEIVPMSIWSKTKYLSLSKPNETGNFHKTSTNQDLYQEGSRRMLKLALVSASELSKKYCSQVSS